MDNPPHPFDQSYFAAMYGDDYERRNPPRKLDYYLSLIRKAKPSGCLLDVGCACGLFLSRARRFFEVTGCDVSAHAVDLARRRLPDVKIHRAGIEELDLIERFDLVTGFDVLEHVPDPPGALRRMRNLLTENGILALTVPVYDGIPGALVRLADRDPTHLWKEGRRFWRRTLSEHGFVLIEDAGLWRSPLPGGRYLFFGGRRWRNFSPALMLIGKKDGPR